MDNKRMHKFRIWKTFLFCGGIFGALLFSQFLGIKTAEATTHLNITPSGGNEIINSTSVWYGQLWNLMTISTITNGSVDIYFSNGAGPTNINFDVSIFDLAGNLIQTTVVNTGTIIGYNNTTKTLNFTFSNPNILSTGAYYFALKPQSIPGSMSIGYPRGISYEPGCYKTYLGSGAIDICSGQDVNVILQGSAGGANANISFPTNNSTSTLFQVFKLDYYVPNSTGFTFEINTAKGSEDNLNDCAGWNTSAVCYRLTEQAQYGNGKIVNDYELRTNGFRLFFEPNNYYFSQFNLIQNGSVIASSSVVTYFITSTTLFENSAYPNNDQPPPHLLGDIADPSIPIQGPDYSSCNSTSTFSASTLISEGFCYLGKWSENFFLQPSESSDLVFKNSVNEIKRAFPFSIIYGIVDPTILAVQSESEQTGTTLTFNYKNGDGQTINVPFLSDTSLSGAVGTETKDTIFQIMEYIIWIGAGWLILSFII